MSKGKTHVEIVPAVLPRSYDDLFKSIGRLTGLASVQVDIVDGVFAPNTTWPYKDQEHFESIVSGDEGMPGWEEFEFEFDLMLQSPKDEVLKYVHAGASRIVLHVGCDDLSQTLEVLREARGGEFAIMVGLALTADANPDALEPYKDQFDFIQVMGIEKVGFQGQAFAKDALTLIQKLKNQYPTCHMQVDGGVSLETAPLLAKAGVERLIVGSAILKSDDPLQAFKAISRAANSFF